MVLKNLSKILVTGGAGFIGSHLVDRLLNEGYSIVVLDNLCNGNLNNLPKKNQALTFIKADVRNFDAVKAAMTDVDAVFHEAAQISVPQSVADPITTNNVNLGGTLNVLKAASDCGVKKFVFASTAAVYGNGVDSEITESTATVPSSPYGISKLAAENYVLSFFKLYGLNTVVLRYFNVFGPRQSFDLKNSYGGVVTIFTNSIINGVSPTIYGDGEQTRDFVYVDDIVEANLLALKSNDAAGGFFNIGSGQRTSVNQIALLLKKYLNKEELPTIYAPPRAGDIRHSYTSIKKATETLGYHPKITFDKGLSQMIKWYTGTEITKLSMKHPESQK